MKKNNKGFSLVELIIVIAIMAILAGALAPALIKYINKSRRSSDISNADTIASAIQTALSNEDAYDSAWAVAKNNSGIISDTIANLLTSSTYGSFATELSNTISDPGTTKYYLKGGSYAVQINMTDSNEVTVKASDTSGTQVIGDDDGDGKVD